jgi:hypothetical protein
LACCPGANASLGRCKLWELEVGTHCSIIGTCLGLDDLHRIMRKADIAIAPDAQDYDIHGYFVTWAGSRSALSKLIHKTLDRKYAPQLVRFHRSRTPDELWELWCEAMTSGDVAGAYWALMTHKAAPRAMRIRAFNEVHMLSHLMGKSSRDDIKRARQFEAAHAEMAQRLRRTRARTDAALKERDARIRALEAKLTAATVAPPAPTGATQERRKRNAQADRLRARFATLERRLKVERARARSAERRLAETVEEGDRVPSVPQAVASETVPSNSRTAVDESQGEGLRRCALLYVGGYRDVTPRLRAYVESIGGTLLYHDGGIEMQTQRLPGLVSRVDAVLCPVSCVSHDACLRLKHLCKRQGKHLVLLRSAGLSGFVAAVSRMMGVMPEIGGRRSSTSTANAGVGHGS